MMQPYFGILPVQLLLPIPCPMRELPLGLLSNLLHQLHAAEAKQPLCSARVDVACRCLSWAYL